MSYKELYALIILFYLAYLLHCINTDNILRRIAMRNIVIHLLVALITCADLSALGPDDYLDAWDMANWALRGRVDRQNKITVEGVESPQNPPDPTKDTSNTIRGIMRRRDLGDMANVTIIIPKRFSPYNINPNFGPIKIGDKATGWRVSKLTIRGEQHRWLADDFVKIYGNLVSTIFELDYAADITFADLHMFYAANHAVKITGESAPNNDNYRFYHCILADCGNAIIKASRADPVLRPDLLNHVARGGTVEYCFIGWTIHHRWVTSLPPSSGVADMHPYPACQFAADGQAHGIDVEGGVNWIIRHNLFHWVVPRQKRHHGEQPEIVPYNFAVRVWRRAQGTTIEGNRFFQCEVPIALGYESTASGGAQDNKYDHEGGNIINNMIFRRCKIRDYRLPEPCHWKGWLDNFPQIILRGAHGVEIVNNSFQLHFVTIDGRELWPAGPNDTYAIRLQYADTSARIENNLFVRDSEIEIMDGASCQIINNYWKGMRWMYRYIPPDCFTLLFDENHLLGPHGHVTWGWTYAHIEPSPRGPGAPSFWFGRFNIGRNLTLMHDASEPPCTDHNVVLPDNDKVDAYQIAATPVPGPLYILDPSGEGATTVGYACHPAPLCMHLQNIERFAPGPLDGKQESDWNLRERTYMALKETLDGTTRDESAEQDWDTGRRPTAANETDFGADEWGVNKPPRPKPWEDSGGDSRPKNPVGYKSSFRPVRLLSREEYINEIKTRREANKSELPNQPTIPNRDWRLDAIRMKLRSLNNEGGPKNHIGSGRGGIRSGGSAIDP